MKNSHKVKFCLCLTAGVLGGMQAASVAYACSAISCVGATVLPAGGEVPLDQLQFVFRSALDRSDADAEPTVPHLYRVDGDQRTELTLQIVANEQDRTYSLRPVAAVEAGTKLLLEGAAPGCGPDKLLAAQFTVTAASAVPASLGTLQVRSVKQDLLTVATTRGSCNEDVEASFADLSVSLSDGAAPFRDVVAYQLVLDGNPYRGFYSTLGIAPNLERGLARVYAPCVPDSSMSLVNDVQTGEHRALMRGVLPSGAIVETPEVQFTLACNETTGPLAASDPPGASTDAQQQDESDDVAVIADDGCSVGRRNGAGTLPWLMAAGLAGAFWRRRRRAA